ncbi:MAG: ATPase [Treponema sp. CETP13]|nr:MAG: ATPase [Treponema sp. CETP13]
MIVPMKKVSLVVLDSERKEVLKKLRKLSVVHLDEVKGSGQNLEYLKGEYDSIQKACSLLSEVKLPKGSPYQKQKKLSKEDSLVLAKKIEALFDKKKSLYNIIASNTSEIERLNKWGGVNPDDFEYLKEKGVTLSLYEIANAKYLELPDDVQSIFVNRDRNITRFMFLSEDGTEPEDMPAEAFSVVMPTKSTRELSAEIEESKVTLKKIDLELESYCVYLKALKDALSIQEKQIEFENVYSGMWRESQDTTLIDENETHDKDEKVLFNKNLACLTGYVPAEKISKLQKTSKENHWALMTEDPAIDDTKVPTKLKNNKLVSLIYPVTDFLGTVPGYHEYDISGWFLLFLTLFFAMIWGDAGYGAILTLGALLGIFVALSKKKKVSPAILLLLLLGVTTVVWGVITCNYFGIQLDYLPEWLKNLSIPALSNATAAESAEKSTWVNQNMQIFCFSVALVQLSIAHIKGIVHFIKSPRCLGEFGSLFMVWGMYYVVLFLVVDKTRFPFDSMFGNIPVSSIVLGLIGIGFILNFMFSSYEGSLKDSVLNSCINIVSVLLGVVNVFSDIVSYIRLWAVALAGAAISATVNSMAGPLLGGFIIFAGILILFVGHGLNLMLNVLSVIVHGVRLNTLEFTSHLGMEWSGFNYKPFSED